MSSIVTYVELVGRPVRAMVTTFNGVGPTSRSSVPPEMLVRERAGKRRGRLKTQSRQWRLWSDEKKKNGSKPRPGDFERKR
jgi:hypothetical protein